MKTYKLIAICIASLFFGACSDGLDEAVGLHVKVATNENVSFDGQVITAKKGTPIEFIVSGDQWRSGQQIRISRTRND